VFRVPASESQIVLLRFSTSSKCHPRSGRAEGELMHAARAPMDECAPDVKAERIETEIHLKLCSTGYRVLRLVECSYNDGTAVLRGRVPTYYHKQIAQSILLADPRVATVVNLIDVSADNLHCGLDRPAVVFD
jgi:hypothetical protein